MLFYIPIMIIRQKAPSRIDSQARAGPLDFTSATYLTMIFAILHYKNMSQPQLCEAFVYKLEA